MEPSASKTRRQHRKGVAFAGMLLICTVIPTPANAQMFRSLSSAGERKSISRMLSSLFSMNIFQGNTSSSSPTAPPTGSPTTSPTTTPTASPTTPPSTSASAHPTGEPTTSPSTSPSAPPTSGPSSSPSTSPSVPPSGGPTGSPTTSPTTTPSAPPTATGPTTSLSTIPSAPPTSGPSSSPSTSPSVPPSTTPSAPPTFGPSSSPSTSPSVTPSISSSPTVCSESESPVGSDPKFDFTFTSGYFHVFNPDQVTVLHRFSVDVSCDRNQYPVIDYYEGPSGMGFNNLPFGPLPETRIVSTCLKWGATVTNMLLDVGLGNKKDYTWNYRRTVCFYCVLCEGDWKVIANEETREDNFYPGFPYDSVHK